MKQSTFLALLVLEKTAGIATYLVVLQFIFQ